jgi:threonine synthase
MLFVTTRNKFDTYTVHRANQSDRGPDGGLFLPFRLPELSKEDIKALKEQSFCQRLATLLNQFFGTQLTAWDVELYAGKTPVKLVPMSHRIVVAETWHNPDWDFARIVRNLSGRIRGNDDTEGVPSNWAWIAIRVAVLFGLFG